MSSNASANPAPATGADTGTQDGDAAGNQSEGTGFVPGTSPFQTPQTGDQTGADTDGLEGTDGDGPVAKFLTQQVTVEQPVDLPAVHYARNGTRKNSSRWATTLANTALVSLRPDTCAVLADNVIDIDRVIDTARNRHLAPTRAANLLLGQAVGQVLSGCVLPVENPRNGHVAKVQVKHPTQAQNGQGMLAEADRVIDSFDVLRAAVYETVKNTLDLGGEYQESIVATGVIDPILIRPTRTTLVAENVSFTALEATDGTTRAVTSLSVLLNTKNAETIAGFILDAFFAGHVEPHTGPEPLDITGEVRENLRIATRKVLNDYWTRVAEHGEDDPQALRIQQALSLPATFTLSVEARSKNARTFVEALDILVRNTHLNRRNWMSAAEANNLARTVVTALVEQGLLGEDAIDLLVADSPTACAAALAPYGYVAGNVDATLWRAATLLCIFTRPKVRAAAKKVIAQAVSLQRVTGLRYAAVVSTLLDLPWRDTKAKSANQAHRAWQRGGALVKEMLEGPAWAVVYTADVDTLTGRDGRDVRLTLAALGGTALIADRFLTADAVAGVGDGGKIRMPYKVSTINTLIEMLAREANTDGRRQLAVAAQVFDPAGESSSAWRSTERSERQQALNALKIANAKATADGRATDVHPLPTYYATPAVTGGDLNAVTLLTVADHDNALTDRAAVSTKDRQTGKKPAQPKSPLEQVALARKDLLGSLGGVVSEIEALDALAADNGLMALDPAAHADAMRLVNAALARLFGMAPVTGSSGLGVADDLTMEQVEAEVAEQGTGSGPGVADSDLDAGDVEGNVGGDDGEGWFEEDER